MWIQDLTEALNRLPEKYIYSCCFDSVIAGDGIIILKSDTITLVYYIGLKIWKEK